MKQLFRLIRKYVRPYKWSLVGAVFMNIFSAIFNVFSFMTIIPVLKILFAMDTTVYEFIDWSIEEIPFKEKLLNNLYFYVTDLIAQIGASNTLIVLGAFLVVTTLLKTSCYFGSAAVMIPLRTGIIRDIRNETYARLVELPMSFFSKNKKGDLMSRMSTDIGEVENSIASVLDMLIKDPILIISYFAVLLYTSWELTAFTLAVVPLMAWGMGAVGRKLKEHSVDAQTKLSATVSHLEETLTGLRVIKAFVAERKMKESYNARSNAARKAVARVTTRQALAHPLSEFLGTVMIMIVLWFGGTLILKENAGLGSANFIIDAPTFIFYLVILYSVLEPLKELARASYSVPKGLASAERLDLILLAKNDIEDPANPVEKTSVEDCIEVKNLWFEYEEGTPVLKNVNIKVKKGQTVALVGQSGSGKTTLVDLIPRFYDATSGGVYVDGVNVKDMKKSTLRGLMGNVNQEAILFNDTIFANIAFGVENATMEDVVAAAKIANAHDFIMEKENGYMENIGDRGCKLSGGQRQRISIARAILKNPEILILDEATSALDTESERLVQEALDRLTKSRTTIAIAHRLSTIKDADRIYVFRSGEIVEEGTHQELIEKNGVYTALYNMQSL